MPAIKRTHAEYQERKAHDTWRVNKINNLIGELTKAEFTRLNDMITRIIDEHVKLTQTDGFYFSGKVFTNISGVSYATLSKVPIHPSLKARATEYIHQCKELDQNSAKIRQGIAVLIRDAHSDQDLRDALPDALTSLVDNGRLTNLPRTKEEGHTLTSKLHKQQFERTMDKVYYYLGSRLLG